MTASRFTSRQLAARRFSAELPELSQLSAKLYADQLSDVEQLLSGDSSSPSPHGSGCPSLSQDLLQFAAAAKASLWDSLPRPRCVGSSRRQREQLIRTYSNACTLLRYYRKQVETFFQWKIVSMIDSNPAKFTNEQQTAYGRLVSMIQGEPPADLMPGSSLTADLAALPPEVLGDELERDLQKAVDHLVEYFFRMLRYGIEQHWFGLVTWMREDICRFTFSTADLIAHPPAYEWDQSKKQRVLVYRFDYRASLHEHHLINAKCAPHAPGRAFVPERYWPLLESMPDFIRPQVATLDGWLIRERIVGRDLQVPDYAREIRIPVPVRPPDLDPAVLLGPVVLFAWSEREFTAPTGVSAWWQERWRACCRPTRPYLFL